MIAISHVILDAARAAFLMGIDGEFQKQVALVSMSPMRCVSILPIRHVMSAI